MEVWGTGRATGEGRAAVRVRRVRKVARDMLFDGRIERQREICLRDELRCRERWIKAIETSEGTALRSSQRKGTSVLRRKARYRGCTVHTRGLISRISSEVLHDIPTPGSQLLIHTNTSPLASLLRTASVSGGSRPSALSS